MNHKEVLQETYLWQCAKKITPSCGEWDVSPDYAGTHGCQLEAIDMTVDGNQVEIVYRHDCGLPDLKIRMLIDTLTELGA